MGVASGTGLISGINYGDIVNQLVQLESKPIDLLKTKKTNLQSVSAELSTLSVKLGTLQSAAKSLSSLSNFNGNTVAVTKNSSGVDLLSATADRTAVAGTTQIQVNQLAQANSIASQGFVDDDTTGVASADGTFKFKVGTAGAVTSVSVTTDTTLVQLRDAINAANGSVSASIINDGSGSNPYRLVLTAKDSGAANSISITSNPTSLDFTNKQIEAAYAQETNSYAGTVSSNEGTDYTGTTNKQFLVKIVTGGDPGTATYKYSTDGGITFLGANGAAYDGTNAITTQTSLTNYIDDAASSNSTNEGVQIAFGASSGTLVAGDQFSIDVFNPTLQEAKDAVIDVGSLTISKSSNTISDVIQGVTLNLLQADSSSTIDVTVSEDTTDINSQVNSFISAYNDVISYLHDQLSFDPQNPDANKAKPLLGDTTAILLNQQLQNLITATVPGSSSGLNSLAKLGVSTNTDTSEIKLDDSVFQAALAQSLTDVTRLFIGIGVPTNSQIEYLSKTDNTEPGTYGVVITTAPTRATVLGANTVPTGGISADETLSVSFYTDATSSTNTPTTAQITASAGSKINDIVNALNSEFATKGMAVSASNNNGKIQIRANEYGDDYRIQVLSSLNDPSNQSGFSTTVDDSTDSDQTAGVDVAGTINGFKANGKGAVLTSGSGFPDDGLSIRAAVATTGTYGNITVSSGVADRMATLLARLIDTSSGSIKVRQDGLADSVADIDKQIQKKQDAVAVFQQQTQDKFNQLEVILGKMKTQGDALTAGLTSIANLQSQINNR